ncbi:hypothetical protein JJD41_14340 [Oxynema sp. CENA135]|uniref:hypothetical protein n=1 Tax=Oxynema sp. CENA135 TaxID=984206 RepID=UPI00190D6674|nr:hypothetical protein [Oxynema sp. CENA135]MBK4731030.1 hypothetical protein [Oxynema sp. CENA135]
MRRAIARSRSISVGESRRHVCFEGAQSPPSRLADYGAIAAASFIPTVPSAGSGAIALQ